jgi:hypothetical protein
VTAVVLQYSDLAVPAATEAVTAVVLQYPDLAVAAATEAVTAVVLQYPDLAVVLQQNLWLCTGVLKYSDVASGYAVIHEHCCGFCSRSCD